MSEREKTELAPLPSAAGPCRVFLQITPDGLSFLAHVRFPSPPALFVPAEASAAGGLVPVPEVNACGEVDTGTLLRILRQVHELVHGRPEAGEAIPPADPEDRVAGQLEENRRLRTALDECVRACDRFLSRAEDALPFEGYEADHSLAQLALDRARAVLAQPPALPERTTAPAGSDTRVR